MGESESLANDSEIRMMASSWRTVMGIEDRALAAISAEWICRRMETKCDESFSAASTERRGAQRLLTGGQNCRKKVWRVKFDGRENPGTYDLQ